MLKLQNDKWIIIYFFCFREQMGTSVSLEIELLILEKCMLEQSGKLINNWSVFCPWYVCLNTNNSGNPNKTSIYCVGHQCECSSNVPIVTEVHKISFYSSIVFCHFTMFNFNWQPSWNGKPCSHLFMAH